MAYKKLSELRPIQADLNLWRCKHCNVGVLTRDRPGHLRRCQRVDTDVEKHFRFDRDLAA